MDASPNASVFLPFPGVFGQAHPMGLGKAGIMIHKPTAHEPGSLSILANWAEDPVDHNARPATYLM